MSSETITPNLAARLGAIKDNWDATLAALEELLGEVEALVAATGPTEPRKAT